MTLIGNGKKENEPLILCCLFSSFLFVTLFQMILYPLIRMDDRRTFNRIRQESIVIINEFEGFLIDFSVDGLGISVIQMPSEKEIKIKLILDQNEFLLTGEIIWEGWNKRYSDRSDIGIKLIDPPTEYINFVKRFLPDS